MVRSIGQSAGWLAGCQDNANWLPPTRVLVCVYTYIPLFISILVGVFCLLFPLSLSLLPILLYLYIYILIYCPALSYAPSSWWSWLYPSPSLSINRSLGPISNNNFSYDMDDDQLIDWLTDWLFGVCSGGGGGCCDQPAPLYASLFLPPLLSNKLNDLRELGGFSETTTTTSATCGAHTCTKWIIFLSLNWLWWLWLLIIIVIIIIIITMTAVALLVKQ